MFLNLQASPRDPPLLPLTDSAKKGIKRVLNTIIDEWPSTPQAEYTATCLQLATPLAFHEYYFQQALLKQTYRDENAQDDEKIKQSHCVRDLLIVSILYQYNVILFMM